MSKIEKTFKYAPFIIYGIVITIILSKISYNWLGTVEPSETGIGIVDQTSAKILDNTKTYNTIFLLLTICSVITLINLLMKCMVKGEHCLQISIINQAILCSGLIYMLINTLKNEWAFPIYIF
jgi:hypothetical protein